MEQTKVGKPLIFGKTDFTIRSAEPMFLILYTTFVELWLLRMDYFYENHILQWKN